MILPSPAEAIHQAWLYRILSAVADNEYLVSVLRFKGGTCLAMRGIIERFSVDLDFDLLDAKQILNVKKQLSAVFTNLGLEIKDQSRNVPQYFLKYRNQQGSRNTVKFDVTCPPPVNNKYEPVRFKEIDRIIFCETFETMFANKLVATLERYEKNRSIAGRDLFDIHTFFVKGIAYDPKIIEERRATNPKKFFHDLTIFIQTQVTQTIIDQDLNHLLPPKNFQKIRKYLKQEVLMFLEQAAKSGQSV